MTNRKRFLAPLVALALTVPATPSMAQSDGDTRTMGDVIADGLEDLARRIGSAQDEISDLAEGIDPSDPDAPVDPGSPDDGDAVDPGDIDPSDPGSNPGDPLEPDSDTPGADDGDGDSGIELPEPSEPEEGGFREIQLLPDPPPRAGVWKVVNQPGTMTCTGAGSIPLKLSRQRTRIAVRQDGRVLQGPRLVPNQPGRIELTWQPDTEAYTGVVRVPAPGGSTRIRFYLRVVNPGKMQGEMVATVKVNARGVRGRCAGTRSITLTHE